MKMGVENFKNLGESNLEMQIKMYSINFLILRRTRVKMKR